jgi:N-acetyl-gamma-glutamyl-phosphate reductase
MIKAGVFGASGYTGFELVQILSRHPDVEIVFATSESSAGKCLTALFPAGPELPLVAAADAPLDSSDVVFLCLPHAAAAETAVTALAHHNRVIDLSADFRLKEASTYEAWYGTTHPAPELLETAVYGLTEFTRDQLATAPLVANPGCYPTSILLALQPLLANNVNIASPIIADSKSGVSGAGRAPKQNTHFVEVANNFSPYKIGRSHRHLPEIEQGMSMWRPAPPALIFSPHLLPVPRGILSTIYVNLTYGADLQTLHNCYLESYGREPFVKVLPLGELATLSHVVHTNRCAISLTLAGQTLIITSAIDNLVKGAAGQAVQNMNVMFGLQETAGLV